MQSIRTILNMKYARIISKIAAITRKDSSESMGLSYNSPFFPLIDNGVADLHCLSDKYLTAEVLCKSPK